MAYNDAFPIVSNFYETALTSQVTKSDTTLYVGSTKDLPKIIAGRDYIPMVLTNGSDVREVVYVKSFTGNSLFVSRGREGTEAQNWPDLTYMYATMTAHGLQQMRINGFSPVLNDNGDRPPMTKVGAQSFTMYGDWTHKIEPNTAVRLLSKQGVVPMSNPNLGAIHITQVEYVNNVTTFTVRNAVIPSDVEGIDIGMERSSAPLYTPTSVYGDGTSVIQNGNTLSVPAATDTKRGLVNASDIIRLAQSSILDAAYPVGSIYISAVATSPATLFGGTWKALGGRFLLGANSTYGAGTTGGEATHTLSLAEMPKHNHVGKTKDGGSHSHTKGTLRIEGTAPLSSEMLQSAATGALKLSSVVGSHNTGKETNGNMANLTLDTSTNGGAGFTGETSTSGTHHHEISISGDGQAHNNMPPYLSVYMWQRTA